MCAVRRSRRQRSVFSDGGRQGGRSGSLTEPTPSSGRCSSITTASSGWPRVQRSKASGWFLSRDDHELTGGRLRNERGGPPPVVKALLSKLAAAARRTSSRATSRCSKSAATPQVHSNDTTQDLGAGWNFTGSGTRAARRTSSPCSACCSSGTSRQSRAFQVLRRSSRRRRSAACTRWRRAATFCRRASTSTGACRRTPRRPRPRLVQSSPLPRRRASRCCSSAST